MPARVLSRELLKVKDGGAEPARKAACFSLHGNIFPGCQGACEGDLERENGVVGNRQEGGMGCHQAYSSKTIGDEGCMFLDHS